MAVKVYTPGQFYAAGGVIEEMFYQEVGRTKKYLRKRVGFVRSFCVSRSPKSISLRYTLTNKPYNL